MDRCVCVVCFPRTRLGQYEANNFADDRVRAPLAKFEKTIEDIEVDLTDA